MKRRSYTRGDSGVPGEGVSGVSDSGRVSVSVSGRVSVSVRVGVSGGASGSDLLLQFRPDGWLLGLGVRGAQLSDDV